MPDEIALYDRQIRLWGMGTQLRLMTAKVLIINLSALGCELVKNLVLGGVNSIEILDSSTIKEEDFLAQFFLPNDDSVVGQLKLPVVLDNIKQLNNRVNISTNTTNFSDLLKNSAKSLEYFAKFDLIIGTSLTKDDIFTLNYYTRSLKLPLYVAGLHGMFGYIMSDLIKHISVSVKDAGNQPRTPGTKLTDSKRITHVDYNKKDQKETVTIEDDFVKIEEIFNSKKLPQQLNKRQMKRLSAAFPLVFALFELDIPQDPEDTINFDLLNQIALQKCDMFGIPRHVITSEYVELFSRQAYTEFVPVSAILGGCLAQEVIQFLSKKESPINNCLIINALKTEMPIYLL